MPELPEVEIRRRYLVGTSLHQPIQFVEVEDVKLLTVDYDALREGLIGRSFVGTERVGKNLFVQLDTVNVYLHLHFGMTGDLAYFHSSADRPRHARIVFGFQNGFNLGFVCPRKFERVGLVTNINDYLARKKIAPDALLITPDELTARILRRRSPIKPVLLDQSTVAGLGNWIVDEVLFQARIHPEQLANSLTNSQLLSIHATIRLVLDTAIASEANYRDFPKSFLIHARRWDTSPYADPEADQFCPRCATRIERSEVGGRTTFFCPNEQVIH